MRPADGARQTWLAAAAMGVAGIVVGVAFARLVAPRPALPSAAKPPVIAEPSERRSLGISDVSQYADLFGHGTEVYLSNFAQPDAPCPALDREETLEILEDDLVDALEDDIYVYPSDAKEVADLKRVVAGLKEEAATLLNAGRSLDEVREWFENRQEMEYAYRTQREDQENPQPAWERTRTEKERGPVNAIRILPPKR